MELESNYKKYKWFCTSSGKLVVGGKSAEQNDELLKLLKKQNKECVMMHTSEPGSPFSVILADVKDVKKSDIEECAVFTASFSRAWKLGKKTASIDIFKSSEIYKDSRMKTGTWGVLGRAKKVNASLMLVLTKQRGVLRAVPEKSIKSKKEMIVKILPGNISKEDVLAKIQLEFGSALSHEELLSALPSGGFKVIK